jgi:hypothetical protein
MLTLRFSRCPLCDTPADSAEVFKVADASSHPAYRPELPASMRWLRCQSCGHIFTESYRNEQGDAVLYSSALPHQLNDPRQSRGLI